MDLPEVAPFRVTDIAVTVYRAPIAKPVRTAFGAMTDRPAVVVRASADDGTIGWGEIWCNFPTCGAEHRARLVASVLAPMVVGQTWQSPETVFATLTERTRKLALQAGEPGPIAQAIAGIDIALWDMAARRAGRPLWRFLGGQGNGRMPAYASGINPEGTAAQALAARDAGFAAFKLKVGFGRELDLYNFKNLRKILGPETPIAVDANQAWTTDEAIAMSQELAGFGPLWLEEPIAVDCSIEDWRRLAEVSAVPLAGGENLRGMADFEGVIAAESLQVIQPDLAKWGGISGCWPLARRIIEAGRRYCPHYLGGGIGLMASAHLLAASGGDGLLEIDCNFNPLREDLAQPYPTLEDGCFVLPDQPGLGVEPGPEVEQFEVWSA